MTLRLSEREKEKWRRPWQSISLHKLLIGEAIGTAVCVQDTLEPCYLVGSENT